MTLIIAEPVSNIMSEVTTEMPEKNQYDKYQNWIWCDIESSGIDPKRSEILEICVIVTDSNMEIWDSMHLIIHHPMSVLLTKSSNWCKRHFGSLSYNGNGLFDQCNRSSTSYKDAEIKLWHFFEYYSCHPVGVGRPNMNIYRQYFDRVSDTNGSQIGTYNVNNTIYSSRKTHRGVMLAGSTVHFDRGFLMRFFPGLKPFMSHKVIDVTSLLEMTKRFRPELLVDLGKPSGNHRACDDILDSIKLFKFITDNLNGDKDKNNKSEDVEM